MNQKNPTAATKAAEAPKKKPTETLKVAYTRTEDAIGDVVVFGTDEARSDFLRSEPDVWWRIADLAKGQSLRDALGQGGTK